MRFLILLAIWTLTFAVSADDAAAVIYKYRDESGRLIFVDDAGKVPAQYRDQVNTIREQKDLPPVTEAPADGQETDEETRAEKIIDLESQRQAREQAAAQEKQRAYQTPVMVRNNRVMVPVEILHANRQAHLFLLLDPDSPQTVLYRSSLGVLQLPEGVKTQASLAGGKTVSAHSIEIDMIEIGPFPQNNSTALIVDSRVPQLPYDGILGHDFLLDHPYTVDTKNEMLRWKVLD